MTVRQCQRLIIILSTEDSSAGRDKEGEPLCDHSQLCYEQNIGLYDALLLNDPKVILVEIGEQRLKIPLPKHPSDCSTCTIMLILPWQVLWITAAYQNLYVTSEENKDL